MAFWERWDKPVFTYVRRGSVHLAWCILGVGSGEGVRPVAPSWAYASVSVSNLVATLCQSEALKHVSFPTQTLGKCSKMIPVMIWGSAILRKGYGPKDYLNALAITIGCTLFLLTGAVQPKFLLEDSSTLGMLLMLGFLAFDGFNTTYQDNLFQEHQMSVPQQVLYVQAFSAGFSLLGLLSERQLGKAVHSVLHQPQALPYIVGLSAVAALGHFFIAHTIRSFGALAYATVVTTRQFASPLLSCIATARPLTEGQWVGTAVACAGLYHLVSGWREGREDQKRDSAGSQPGSVEADSKTAAAVLAGATGGVTEEDVQRPDQRSAAAAGKAELV
ncbi:hypothetical protein N2152v2_007301 [Parachlorella kessleri]